MSIGVITPFLLLHAFSSGTSALTGIEAISNGITAFKEPRSKNAGKTLIVDVSHLGDLIPRHLVLVWEDRRCSIRIGNRDFSIGAYVY